MNIIIRPFIDYPRNNRGTKYAKEQSGYEVCHHRRIAVGLNTGNNNETALYGEHTQFNVYVEFATGLNTGNNNETALYGDGFSEQDYPGFELVIYKICCSLCDSSITDGSSPTAASSHDDEASTSSNTKLSQAIDVAWIIKLVLVTKWRLRYLGDNKNVPMNQKMLITNWLELRSQKLRQTMRNRANELVGAEEPEATANDEESCTNAEVTI
ncbi:hypothetical protein QE152_g40500 [Popillia japonica]|uniref:Uncharacterized protein n=1 Tax=Popillia japonica TaxID=7064 RepID=A0AAW1HFW7_POPJA